MKPTRPASVHIAALLQTFAVLLSLVAVVLAWIGHTTVNDRYMRFAESDNTMAFAVVITAIGGLTVLWFGLTLLPTWLGSNTARLMTTIGAAFYQLVVVLFCICGGLFAFFTMPMRMMPDDPFYPGTPQADSTEWEQFAASMVVLSIAVLLLAVLVLLIVPPSNRFYAARKAAGSTMDVQAT